MYAGDEFYDDDVTSGVSTYDPLVRADWIRDEAKNASSCPSCGSPSPTRLGDGGCSDCVTYPRCGVCRAWVGDGSGWLPGYRWVRDEDGLEMRVCERCWEDVP